MKIDKYFALKNYSYLYAHVKKIDKYYVTLLRSHRKITRQREML